MRAFLGTFKDRDNKDVTVSVTPYNQPITEVVEIRFPYEEPVIIEVQAENVFTPVKTTSCTIKLFTDEIYWDLYTPSATGYLVQVSNQSLFLFRGFLTPCVYTQDYLYKSEIELEAVDLLAVTELFKYKDSREIITVEKLLENTIVKSMSNNNPTNGWYINKTLFDFTKLYVQEANFFDDDGEPMTCKEILEELFTYLGCTIISYGRLFIIYEVKADTVKETLDINKYGSGNPTVELDEVYNKISFGCNLYEVDDIIDDVIDKDNKTIVNELKYATDGVLLYSDYYFSWREHNHHTTDKHRYTMLVKPYQFVDSTIADNKNYTASRWKTYRRILSNNALSEHSIETAINNDTNIYKDESGNKLFIPYYLGAYPIRQYSYSKAEGIASKSKINWNEYLMFPALDNNAAKNDRQREVYPAISFYNDENLAYSIDGGTGYLLFNGDLWCLSDIGIKGVDTDVIWTDGYRNGTKQTVAVPVCMENMDLSFGEDIKRAYKCSYGSAGYNTGWEMIKAQLKIGDKYWNGTQWTTLNSTFYIRYHDDDVTSDDETLNYFTWLKVASNPNVPKINVGDDGYAVPITAADRLNGKLEFTMWTPKLLPRCVNNFFMRDVSLKYVYKDSTNWADDKKVENDIVYENIINETWATDMPEIDLKINSWYKDKPISKSYLLDANKLPVIKINGKVQEDRLLELYYNHYSTPKKIFNLNYRSLDVYPTKTFYHTLTDTNYNILSYEMDIKQGETNYKLIEV